VVLSQLGLGRKAFPWARIAEVLNPANERCNFLIGKISLDLKRFSVATHSFCKTVCLAPDRSSHWRWTANSLLSENDTLTANQHAERAALLDSEDSEGILILALTRFAKGDRISSKLLLLDLTNRNPLVAEYQYQLARLLARCGDISAAKSRLEKAVALDPADPDFAIELSFCAFCLNEIPYAWRLYERRLDCVSRDSGRAVGERFRLDVRRYSSPSSGRVLLWPDEGIGDEIKYGSMLGDFRGCVGKLLVQLDRRLIPLFKRSLPDDVEFFERGTVVPEDRYDSHIAIGSLGQYLRPTLESFEGKGGKYLWADPERIQAMREWLSVKEGERVIGLSWRSSNPETGAARSLALKDLVKSLQAPGVRFVNLQYGDVSAEIEALERDEGITVLQCPGLDTTDDLDGLAALIEACDEVVSIGNATAHLAGALGQKTHVLLPRLGVKAEGSKVIPGWRWLGEARTCLWYDGVELWRWTKQESDWSGVLTRLESRGNTLTAMARSE
jgi:tetratricopeptide (TPR) repeat protein